MPTPHPQAEILRAVADGRTVQIENPALSGSYLDLSAAGALNYLADGRRTLRVKPATVIVNGVEVPEPNWCGTDLCLRGGAKTYHVSVIVGVDHFRIPYKCQANAEACYQALIKPFNTKE